jgi:hypothetical protein
MKNILGDVLIKLAPEGMWNIVNGKIEWLTPNIPQPTKEEIKEKMLEIQAEEPWLNLRTERNQLLTETDWTANSDVTMSPEMAEYRQALRDLPSTVDINNPVYPEKP